MIHGIMFSEKSTKYSLLSVRSGMKTLSGWFRPDELHNLRKRGMNMVKMTASELLLPLTEEELQEIEKTESKEPVFDEDSPEMSEKQLSQFRRMYGADRSKQTVSLRLSRNTYNKARTYGKGYTSFLSRLLDVAINDEELVKKCV